jgi:hypothetical protein
MYKHKQRDLVYSFYNIIIFGTVFYFYKKKSLKKMYEHFMLYYI